MRRLCLVLISTFLLGLSLAHADSSPLVRLEVTHDVRFVASRAQLRALGGGMLAVTLIRGDRSSLRLLDLDTRRVLKFKSAIEAAAFPAFSPDGRLMAFEGRSNNHRVIYVSEWNGKHPRRISARNVDAGNPNWVPTSAGVLFYQEDILGNREIYRVDNLPGDASTPVRITSLGGRNTTPAIAPDQSLLAFSSDTRFPGWDVCFLSSEPRVLRCPLGNTHRTFCRPRWAPSSDKIVYSEGQGLDINLFSFDIESQVSERLTNLPLKEYDGEFSPDGQFIAFAHEVRPDETYELAILRVSDRAITRIATSNGSLRYPSWSLAHSYRVAR